MGHEGRLRKRQGNVGFRSARGNSADPHQPQYSVDHLGRKLFRRTAVAVLVGMGKAQRASDNGCDGVSLDESRSKLKDLLIGAWRNTVGAEGPSNREVTRSIY